MFCQAEYIWLDGAKPTCRLRNKTRIVNINTDSIDLSIFPEWGFDGSSTYQAPGNKSDLVLKPVNFVKDPLRHGNNFLVMCEVLNDDNTPHETNTRALLREQLNNGGAQKEPWIGFEQEYTLFHNNRPLGWPKDGYPETQGPFYCAVGNSVIAGRPIIEAHTKACIDAGIMIYGTNAEVMLGQWEFQIGYRGIAQEDAGPLNVADHLWLARWLIHRIAEDFDITVSFDNKPIKGDWNGAGTHTNFSTKAMRNKETGWLAINQALTTLAENHPAHVAVYGYGLGDRLTGLHETCDINTFKTGERDRGASIRIPDTVAKNRCGYIEDRRPGANCDPYLVAAKILETVVVR